MSHVVSLSDRKLGDHRTAGVFAAGPKGRRIEFRVVEIEVGYAPDAVQCSAVTATGSALRLPRVDLHVCSAEDTATCRDS